MQVEEHFDDCIKQLWAVLRQLWQCVGLAHGLGRNRVGKQKKRLKDLVECSQVAELCCLC